MAELQIIADASVIVKWFVEEEYSTEARILQDAYINGLIDIAVPSLLHYEVLNALKYSNAFGEDELKQISQILDDFQFNIYPLTGNYAEKTVEIAMRKGITIYDASYVALSLLLSSNLYTADEKLLRKTEDLTFIKHIKDFKL